MYKKLHHVPLFQNSEQKGSSGKARIVPPFGPNFSWSASSLSCAAGKKVYLLQLNIYHVQKEILKEKTDMHFIRVFPTRQLVLSSASRFWYVCVVGLSGLFGEHLCHIAL